MHGRNHIRVPGEPETTKPGPVHAAARAARKRVDSIDGILVKINSGDLDFTDDEKKLVYNILVQHRYRLIKRWL